MAEPRFLSVAGVPYLHDESLARFGGIAGVGDRGFVKSALGAAQNVYWSGQGNLFEIAAAYAFHLAEAQVFNDGKKRTGVAAAIMFLKCNGITFPADDGSVYNALISIAKKDLDKAGLAEVLRALVEKKNRA